MTQRDKLGKEIEYMEMMLDRATRLISGLAGEKIRWEETVKVILFKTKIILKCKYARVFFF